MVRTIIQLTEEQSLTLKRVARERDTSVAALVRNAVDDMLDLDPQGSAQRAQAALALAGSMHSGLGDLARNHDAYLAEPVAPDR